MTHEDIKSIPHWRIDNFVPLVGMAIALIINIGALFWWGGRLSLNQEFIAQNQQMINKNLEGLTDTMQDWKAQYEVRLGIVESEVKVINSRLGVSLK